MEPVSAHLIYKTYLLDSSSPNIAFLAGKYAALSQLALTTDPEAFGVAYLTEGAFSPADYIARVRRPQVSIFICVGHPEGLDPALYDIEHGHWVGMVTQIGPTPKSIYFSPESGCPEPGDDTVETKWHHTTMWVNPAHRGKGVAGQLINTAIEAAVQASRDDPSGTVKQVRMREFTGPDNETSKALYGSRGFSITGKCTIREAMVANGNPDLPFAGRTDWSDETLDARKGVIMEKVVSIA
ncbi:hypothetical protein H2203_004571 [Taxawa tesnikishii (nom. ined.)]|nr:hypothetical protein H2203_004571 [Dothideales sp. JES 119]